MGLLLMLALAVGVGSAGGRSLAPATPVIIEVIGAGKVTGPGIDCGLDREICFATFSSSGTVTLTAGQPATGWSFAGWGDTGDTDCSGSGAAGCIIPVDGNRHQISATFASSASARTHTLSVGVPNNTGGKVTGGHIACGSGPLTACGWEVLEGSTLTVIETPDPGYVFTGWGGNCNGLRTSCTQTMTVDNTATASFALASTPRTLTVSVLGNGSVSGGGINCNAGSTCSATEPVNSFQTLTPTPAPGFTFTGWTGDCVGNASTCTVQMNADRRVTATFDLTFSLKVTVTGSGAVTGTGISCGGGDSVCTANYPTGTTLTLIETPASGGTFNGWGGACSGTATTCTVVITSSKTVTAAFSSTSQTFPLSVTATGNGTVTGGGINCGNGGRACSVNLSSGTSVTLLASPAFGDSFTSWGGACAGKNTTCILTITAATAVTAAFSTTATSFRLSVSVTGNGKVTGSLITCGAGLTVCAANEPANSTVTLTAAPSAGATFQGWGGACSGTSKTCQVQMSAAQSVTAAFSVRIARATLTLKVVGKGSVVTPAGKCTSKGRAQTCLQVYTLGRRLTLQATPAKLAVFLKWSGACTGKQPTCTVVLTVPRSVTATFSG